MSKKSIFASILIIILLIVFSAGAFAGRYFGKSTDSERKVNEQISVLQRQIEELKGQVAGVSTAEQKNATSLQEMQNRQVIKQKSQDELLTVAVQKITPSVVSVVVSKDVPQLEVVYENPFGNDPFFKDFGFQVPVYRQKGTINQKVGAGSGFIITSDGYILTNKHVVYDTAASYTVLLSSGAQKAAKVVYIDQSNDIAIIKIDGTYSPVSLGNSDSLKLGQSVIAIGNALGEYNNSVSVGIISGLNRTIEASGSMGTEQLSGVIQTDAAINPGNSGGPLADLNGSVVGVNVATVQGSSNISFSIPINTVKSIIKSAINR
jgi:serine protease Do